MAPQDDLDRIMAVMQAAFDPAFGEAWTRTQLEGALVLGGSHYWLIGPDGTPPREGEAAAGFALTRHILDEAELLLFAISPQYRRRGLGGVLLKTVLRDAASAGITTMLLEMRDGNPASILYRHHGFEPIGRRAKYYRGADGTRIDALTFRLDLSRQNT